MTLPSTHLATLRCFVLAPLVTQSLGCASSMYQAAPAERHMQQVAQGSLATPNSIILAEDRSFELNPGPLFNTPFWSDCPLRPDTTNYGDAEAGGARRVRVAYPGMAEPLYGVLAFCEIRNEFHGSASRSYRLQIPQQYVDATDGGRMSVVFEQYEDRGRQVPAWILWLSREPIPHQEGQSPQSRGTSVMEKIHRRVTSVQPSGGEH